MQLQNWSEISEFFIFKKITAVLGLPCDVRSTNWATLLLYTQDGMGSNQPLTNESAICWEVFLQVLEICGACAIDYPNQTLIKLIFEQDSDWKNLSVWMNFD